MRTELEYIFERICARRQVVPQNYESVAFNVVISFGLATNTFLLPVVANTFYFVDELSIVNQGVTGSPTFDLASNSGQGSAGSVLFYGSVAIASIQNLFGLECDSLKYVVSTHTAGSCFLYGTVFKITYE